MWKATSQASSGGIHNCSRHVVSIAAIEGSRVHSGTGPNSVSFHRSPSWLGGAITTASCCSGCEGDERASWSKELGAVQQRIGLAKSCGWCRPAQPRASARAKRPTLVQMRGVQIRRRMSAPGFDAIEKGTMTVILHHRRNLGRYVNGGGLNRPEDASWHSLAVGSRCLLTSRVLIWCCGLSLARGQLLNPQQGLASASCGASNRTEGCGQAHSGGDGPALVQGNLQGRQRCRQRCGAL